MTFRTTKPMQDGLPQAPTPEIQRRSSSAPAFKPQVVRSVRMHPVVAGSVAAVVFVALLALAWQQKYLYLAESQVYEEPANTRLLSTGGAEPFDANKYDTFLGEQMLLAQRLDVLTAAMESLPPATWQEFGATAHQAAEAIQTQIKVARVGTSYQMSISLKGNDPGKTAAIVNAITTAYLDALHKANAAETDQRAQLLAEERQRVEAELQAARTEQTALGAVIGVASPTGDTGNPYDAELSGLRTQLAEARQAHDVAAAQLASLSGQGPSGTSGLTAAADELIGGDSGLSSMKSAISERKASLSGQMAGMTPSNPVYKQDQDEIADLDRTLDTATNELRVKAARRLQDKLRSDLERTGDIESRLNGELARQIAHATSAAPKLQRAGEVAADIQRLDLREAAVDDALRSLRLDANSPAQVRLSLAATPASSPEPNRKKLLLLAALPLALLFGAAAAVLMRKQDRRIYGPVDIEDVLGFPPLAVLPARGDVPDRVFDEYVLRLAAGVESAYRTNGARTFLLTAVSLTTDVRPVANALTRKFEEIGVNVMVATSSDVLSPTVGTQNPDEMPRDTPSQLRRVVDLWSEGFVAANMTRMKAEHGLVLIESEALLNCAQTEYVARCADATILMVECGVTTREELFRAAELLHRLNVTGIGAVLEEVQMRFADADFRKAIESLDRRQSEAAYQRPRTAAGVRVAIVPEEEGWEPEAVPGSVPEATFHDAEEVPHEVLEEVPAVEAELEPAFEFGQAVEDESVKADLVKDYARQTAEIPVAIPLAAPTMLQGAAAAVVGPVLVDTPPVPVRTMEEDIVPERVMAVANGSFREKISPMLSTRRGEPASSGDVRMTRNISWLDRLLRRNPEPVVSIVPDRDVDDEYEYAYEDDGGAEPENEDENVPAVAARTGRNQDGRNQDGRNQDGRNQDGRTQGDYDLPLVTRLEEISRSHRVAPRLQIVPNDAPPAVDYSVTGLFHPAMYMTPDAVEESVAQPEPGSEVAHDFVFEEPASMASAHPAEAVPAEEVVEPFETVANHEAEPVEVEEPIEALALPVIPEPVPEPASAWLARPVVPAAMMPVARPRRPLSFQELAGMAPVGLKPPVMEEPVAVHEAVPYVAEPEPVAEISEHIAEASEEIAPGEPIAPIHLVEPEPFEAAPDAAAWAEPLVAPEPVAAALGEPEEGSVEPPSELEPIYAPEAALARPLLAVPSRSFIQPEPEPVRYEETEPYDVEPVYREASRNLNVGRWDPIPPLRPTDTGWRERPSPVLPTNRAAASDFRSWTGTTEDAPTLPAADRWSPEPPPPAPQYAEPLPEPLLTRQWGLLSRFQQARITSSSRPAAETKDEGPRDSQAPNGNRNRQG